MSLYQRGAPVTTRVDHGAQRPVGLADHDKRYAIERGGPVAAGVGEIHAHGEEDWSVSKQHSLLDRETVRVGVSAGGVDHARFAMKALEVGASVCYTFKKFDLSLVAHVYLPLSGHGEAAGDAEDLPRELSGLRRSQERDAPSDIDCFGPAA